MAGPSNAEVSALLSETAATIARRAWLEPKRLLNGLSAKEPRERLSRRGAPKGK